MKLGHELRLANPSVVVRVQILVRFLDKDSACSPVPRQVGEHEQLELSLVQDAVAVAVGVVPSPPVPYLVPSLFAVPNSVRVNLENAFFMFEFSRLPLPEKFQVKINVL